MTGPTHYVLIDFENVQVKSLALLKGERFKVKVFLGPKNTKLPVDLVLAMHELGEHADYIMLGVSGANALDFHITYYLGKLTAEAPDGHFHIISKDTGFDSLIRHVNSKNLHCQRAASIEAMLGMVPEVTTPTAVKPGHEKPVAASKSKARVKAKAAPANPQIKPAGKSVAAKNRTVTTVAETVIQAAIADLKKRQKSRPATSKTLLSTLEANKNLVGSEVTAVFDALVKRGYIKVDGRKVIYALPGEASR